MSHRAVGMKQLVRHPVPACRITSPTSPSCSVVSLFHSIPFHSIPFHFSFIPPFHSCDLEGGRPRRHTRSNVSACVPLTPHRAGGQHAVMCRHACQLAPLTTCNSDDGPKSGRGDDEPLVCQVQVVWHTFSLGISPTAHPVWPFHSIPFHVSFHSSPPSIPCPVCPAPERCTLA